MKLSEDISSSTRLLSNHLGYLGEVLLGFPACQCRLALIQDTRYMGSIPVSGRLSVEGDGKPAPVFLPGRSHRQRSLVGYSPWGRKEYDTTKRLSTSAGSTAGTLSSVSFKASVLCYEPGFLSFAWIILCNCIVHCRVLSSIPGLHPRDVSGTP